MLLSSGKKFICCLSAAAAATAGEATVLPPAGQLSLSDSVAQAAEEYCLGLQVFPPYG